MHVWVTEIVDEEDWPIVTLTGRFCCSSEDGTEKAFDTLPEAVDWARQRAESVSVEFEGRSYSLPLPDAVLERAALGRRRRPGEEWLDRTPDDPPVEWSVKVSLHPGELFTGGPERARQDAVAAVAEQAVTAAGFDEVWSSTDGLDAGLADIDEQVEAAGGAEIGWTTGHSLAYEIRATIFASTHRQVVERAVQVAADAIQRETGAAVWRQTTDEPLHLSWGVTADVHPVGAEPVRMSSL